MNLQFKEWMAVVSVGPAFLMHNIFVSVLLLRFFSPGVIITDVHKRAGLDEDQYAQVKYHVNTL